jgi:heme-degrading monooxygenase HmoA
MILREWRGRTKSSRAAAYLSVFRETVAPALRRQRGFRGAVLATRQVDDEVEFVVLTRWESLWSVRHFAGSDIERAVVHEETVAELVEFDMRARHYEVVHEVVSGGADVGDCPSAHLP